MRTKIICLLAVLALALCFTACGGDVTDTTAGAPTTDITGDATTDVTEGGPTATPGPTEPPYVGGASVVPTVMVNKLIAYDQYLISGYCGQGAKVTATGGEESVTVSSDNGCFALVVPVKSGEKYELSITATDPGKDVSEAVALQATGGVKGLEYVPDYGETAVVLGNGYQCYFQACIDDFMGKNKISESAATKLTNAVANKLSKISAKVIMVVVPDPSTVYSENVPSEYTPATETYREQFDAAVAAAGMTVLDLTDVLTAHKYDDLKIYQKTDSHWTQYGAYLGYCEIMNLIAQDFPDAAPRTNGEITFENRWVLGGDMAYYLDIMANDFEHWSVGSNTSYDSISKYNLLPEFTNFAKYNMEMPTTSTLYWDNSCRSYFDEVEDRHTVTNSKAQGNLPTAYILRDSFSNQMYDMLNERFSKVTWAKLWSYGIDTNTINKANPDYVIIICNERVLSDVVSQFSSNNRR
ncbi:MAG: hypothetical protein IKC38_03110 [Clostridia bacterium]|nr:hypothetical protein [Clostridia bacterium]